MTNEQIDTLKGRKLDTAFAEAFDFERWHKRQFVDHFDAVLAALPDEWVWEHGKRFKGKGYENDEAKRYFAKVYARSLSPVEAEGPTPATALCRAALKAKAAQQPANPKREIKNLRPCVNECDAGWRSVDEALVCVNCGQPPAAEPATPDVATRVKSITCRVCLAPNHPDHYASCWKCHAPSEGYFNIFTDAEDSQ